MENPLAGSGVGLAGEMVDQLQPGLRVVVGWATCLGKRLAKRTLHQRPGVGKAFGSLAKRVRSFGLERHANEAAQCLVAQRLVFAASQCQQRFRLAKRGSSGQTQVNGLRGISGELGQARLGGFVVLKTQAPNRLALQGDVRASAPVDKLGCGVGVLLAGEVADEVRVQPLGRTGRFHQLAGQRGICAIRVFPAVERVDAGDVRPEQPVVAVASAQAGLHELTVRAQLVIGDPAQHFEADVRIFVV